MLELILASQSPRRRDLLVQAGYDPTVFPVKVSEIIDENLNPAEVASQIATSKLEASFVQHKLLNKRGFLVLAADTIVVLGRRVLGKPRNISEASEYLRALSGKTHSVMTGLVLRESGTTKLWSGVECTDVNFCRLTEAEIEAYVATGEPMDKAGAYAIQGGAKKFVSSFQGSWSNVVGLPLERFEKALKENGWNVRCRASAKSE